MTDVERTAEDRAVVNVLIEMPEVAQLADEIKTLEGIDQKINDILIEYYGRRGQSFLDDGLMRLGGVMRWALSNYKLYNKAATEYVTNAFQARADEVLAEQRAEYMNVLMYLNSNIDRESEEFKEAMDAFRKFHGWYGAEEFRLVFTAVVEEGEEPHLADPEVEGIRG